MAQLTMACLLSAALAYHVPVPAMQAIQAVEGGQAGQEVCQNADGSCDLGPFQVNDRAWVETIADDLGVDPAVVRRTLRDDGCWNARVAAWILRQMLDEAGGDLPTAIGNYHSHLPLEHMLYREKVQRALDRLYPAGVPALPADVAAPLTASFAMPPLVPDAAPGPDAHPFGRLIMVSAAGLRARSVVVRPMSRGASRPAGTELRWGRVHNAATIVYRGGDSHVRETPARTGPPPVPTLAAK